MPTPSGAINFLDLKMQESTPGYDLIEENVRLSPELTVFPADVMEATEIRLTVRTDLPQIFFSNIGDGVVESKSGYITRLFENANLDALIKVPVNLLAGKPAALAGRLMSQEQAGYIEAAIRTIGKQTWYGVGNDSKGFIGIIAQMLAGNVVDATGTDAPTKTSVFFVATGTNKTLYWWGNNRTMSFDDWYRATTRTADNKDIEAEICWMHATPGFQLANRNAVLRIKNITNQTGHTLTWDLMHAAWNKMVTNGMLPDAIFMQVGQQEQLRQDLVTDLLPNPPTPTEFNGVKFQITQNILSGETL